MNDKTYYAHSTDSPDKSDWQPLADHLQEVARLAEDFAAIFRAGNWGRTAGLLHDAGKATDAFQRRLEGSTQQVDHSTSGAQLATLKAGRLGLLLSYAVAGHHGGLPDGGLQEGELHHRLRYGKVHETDTTSLPVAENEELLPPFKLKEHPRFQLGILHPDDFFLSRGRGLPRHRTILLAGEKC